MCQVFHLQRIRLNASAVRTASGPLTSAQIAAAVMQAKEMPPDDAAFNDIVAVRALTVLRACASAEPS
jgi:hypothetical protein